MAYADYNDLMAMSEQLLSGMVKDIRGSYLLEYHTKGRDHPDSKITIDFTPPFRRIQMIPELERLLKVRLALSTSAFLARLLISNCRCRSPRTSDLRRPASSSSSSAPSIRWRRPHPVLCG
jgi:lysyl-tRNA synthetase class II